MIRQVTPQLNPYVSLHPQLLFGKGFLDSANESSRQFNEFLGMLPEQARNELSLLEKDLPTRLPSQFEEFAGNVNLTTMQRHAANRVEQHVQREIAVGIGKTVEQHGKEGMVVARDSAAGATLSQDLKNGFGVVKTEYDNGKVTQGGTGNFFLNRTASRKSSWTLEGENNAFVLNHRPHDATVPSLLNITVRGRNNQAEVNAHGEVKLVLEGARKDWEAVYADGEWHFLNRESNNKVDVFLGTSKDTIEVKYSDPSVEDPNAGDTTGENITGFSAPTAFSSVAALEPGSHLSILARIKEMVESPSLDYGSLPDEVLQQILLLKMNRAIINNINNDSSLRYKIEHLYSPFTVNQEWVKHGLQLIDQMKLRAGSYNDIPFEFVKPYNVADDSGGPFHTGKAISTRQDGDHGIYVLDSATSHTQVRQYGKDSLFVASAGTGQSYVSQVVDNSIASVDGGTGSQITVLQGNNSKFVADGSTGSNLFICNGNNSEYKLKGTNAVLYAGGENNIINIGSSTAPSMILEGSPADWMLDPANNTVYNSQTGTKIIVSKEYLSSLEDYARAANDNGDDDLLRFFNAKVKFVEPIIPRDPSLQEIGQLLLLSPPKQQIGLLVLLNYTAHLDGSGDPLDL